MIRVGAQNTEQGEVIDPLPMSRDELVAHLSGISHQRLVAEVMAMWDELGEMERELAMARQRSRALDFELNGLRTKRGGRGDYAELEERFRVAEARRAQLETMLSNERLRRKEAEDLAGSTRVEELRTENSRLLKQEEEQLLLILDMEVKIDRLVAALKEMQNNV